MNKRNRRQFLQTVLQTASSAGLGLFIPFLPGCRSTASAPTNPSRPPPPTDLAGFNPADIDQLQLAPGFSYQIIVSEGTEFAPRETLGTNGRGLTMVFLEGTEDKEALCWLSHESFTPPFVPGFKLGYPRTQFQIQREADCLGGSLLHIEKAVSGVWQVKPKSPLHRRFGINKKIPFSEKRNIANQTSSLGMIGGASSTLTPWSSFLCGESNYQEYFGETSSLSGSRKFTPGRYQFQLAFPTAEPEHYGWVIEIQPTSDKAIKQTALGRFSHKATTLWPLEDGRCIVYMTEDSNQGSLFKFVADRPGSLEAGSLFVAKLGEKNGEWLPLDIKKSPLLAERFKSQQDILVRCREAAKALGATAFERPDDIEIDASTKSLILSVSQAGRFGQLIRLEEKDPLATEFSHRLLFKSTATKLPNPTDLCMDRTGGLWVSCGLSGLFYLPIRDGVAMDSMRVAVGPRESKLTGMNFSADGKSLFLCVQHPGALSKFPDQPTSHWPEGTGIPRSAVVHISGPGLEALQSGNPVTPIAPMPKLKRS